MNNHSDAYHALPEYIERLPDTVQLPAGVGVMSVQRAGTVAAVTGRNPALPLAAVMLRKGPYISAALPIKPTQQQVDAALAAMPRYQIMQ